MRRRDRRPSRTPRPVVSRDVPFPSFWRPPAVPLVLLEDRRQFHPLASARPVGVVSRRDARVLVERRKAAIRLPSSFPALRLGFAVPEKVVRCVRRKQRREVIFAKRRTGAGARSRRSRDMWSNVSC